jgi:hypothetical protein
VAPRLSFIPSGIVGLIRAAQAAPRAAFFPRFAALLSRLSMMGFKCAAGLKVALTNRDVDRSPVPRGSATAFHDGIKAVLPKAVIFFRLSRDKSEPLALVQDPSASRVPLSGVTAPTCRDGSRLGRNEGSSHYEKCSSP